MSLLCRCVRAVLVIVALLAVYAELPAVELLQISIQVLHLQQLAFVSSSAYHSMESDLALVPLLVSSANASANVPDVHCS